jgi:hypothetical protein
VTAARQAASGSIGAPGFEPGTSSPPDWRANQAAPRPVRSTLAQPPGYAPAVELLGVRVYDRAVSITDEQARWLAEELRALRPLDVTRAAEAAAERIERGLANGSRDVDEESTDDGVRVVLMALEDIVEAPEPLERLHELHDALVAELVRRAE